MKYLCSFTTLCIYSRHFTDFSCVYVCIIMAFFTLFYMQIASIFSAIFINFNMEYFMFLHKKATDATRKVIVLHQ